MANKQKPDNLHLLTGTYRKDRHGDKDKKVKVSIPITKAPPACLSELARVEWRRVVELMEKTGILTAWDYSTLSQYCNLFGEFQEKGYDFPAGKHAQLRMLAIEMGMTPSARSKITLDNNDDGDDF